MDSKELIKTIKYLLATGNRLTSVTGTLLHGNLRSLNHFVTQVDDSIIDWHQAVVSVETLLQRIENESDADNSDCSGSCSCSGASESPDTVCKCSSDESKLGREEFEDGIEYPKDPTNKPVTYGPIEKPTVFTNCRKIENTNRDEG